MTAAPTRFDLPMMLNAAVIAGAAHGSANSWRIIEGYAPMEECVTAGGREVGWICPRNIGKRRPQPWGTAADWPGEWEAIPRGEWELSVYCVSYEAAKAHVEASWPNMKAHLSDEAQPR